MKTDIKELAMQLKNKSTDEFTSIKKKMEILLKEQKELRE